MSQKEKVLKELRANGTVNRNDAINAKYGEIITRLGAIMCELKAEGVHFETKRHTKPNNYEYLLLDKPKIVNYYVQGQIVATKKIWS